MLVELGRCPGLVNALFCYCGGLASGVKGCGCSGNTTYRAMDEKCSLLRAGVKCATGSKILRRRFFYDGAGMSIFTQILAHQPGRGICATGSKWVNLLPVAHLL